MHLRSSKKPSDPLSKLPPAALERLASLLCYSTTNDDTRISSEWLSSQRVEIARLPRDFKLNRSSSLVTFFFLDKSHHARLCSAHRDLRPETIFWAYTQLDIEISIHNDRLRRYRKEYPDECGKDLSDYIDRITGIASLYLSQDDFEYEFGRPDNESEGAETIFKPISRRCAACILSVVGAKGQMVVDLRASLLARRKKRRPEPRLLKLIEAWVDEFPIGFPLEMRHESEAMARELQQFLIRIKALRRAARTAAGGGGSHTRHKEEKKKKKQAKLIRWGKEFKEAFALKFKNMERRMSRSASNSSGRRPSFSGSTHSRRDSYSSTYHDGQPRPASGRRESSTPRREMPFAYREPPQYAAEPRRGSVMGERMPAPPGSSRMSQYSASSRPVSTSSGSGSHHHRSSTSGSAVFDDDDEYDFRPGSIRPESSASCRGSTYGHIPSRQSSSSSSKVPDRRGSTASTTRRDHQPPAREVEEYVPIRKNWKKLQPDSPYTSYERPSSSSSGAYPASPSSNRASTASSVPSVVDNRASWTSSVYSCDGEGLRAGDPGFRGSTGPYNVIKDPRYHDHLRNQPELMDKVVEDLSLGQDDVPVDPEEYEEIFCPSDSDDDEEYEDEDGTKDICPSCQGDLAGLTVVQNTEHVNACLDGRMARVSIINEEEEMRSHAATQGRQDGGDRSRAQRQQQRPDHRMSAGGGDGCDMRRRSALGRASFRNVVRDSSGGRRSGGRRSGGRR